MITNPLIDIASHKPIQSLTKYIKGISIFKSKNNIKNLRIPTWPSFSVTILILYGLNLHIYSQQIKFQHLTIENGLSNNKVKAVLQDKTGFMWFGTNDGLNRYDGYNFKIFRNNPNDSNSISDNGITTLFEDSNGIIWIGTKTGILNKYNPISEKFTHFRLNSNINGNNNITAIYEDKKGNFWIGTNKQGLYKLDSLCYVIKHWRADTNKTNSLSHNYVTSITEGNKGNIIVGTYFGLNIFNPAKPANGFKTFYHEFDNTNSLSNNIIWTLSKSSIDSNIIWLGTFKNITKYNSENSSFKRIKIKNNLNILHGKSCGYVIDEMIKGENIVWVNSYGGLLRINLTSGKTGRFIHSENNIQSLINNQINKIMKDRTGVLWVATEGGLSFSTPKSTLFNSYKYNYNSTLLLEGENITAISKFNNNRIWIGSDKGLYLLYKKNKKPQLKKITKFSDYSIWSIEAVGEHEIWIGTYGKGLKQFNYIKNKVTNWDLNKTKFHGQSIYFNKTLLGDSKNNLWIGYWGVGVTRLNLKSGTYNTWLNEPKNNKSLSDNSVWVIVEDQLGRIWLGTKGGGINLFENKEGGIFHRWLHNNKNVQPELSGNNIYSIYEATKNKSSDNSETVLWIGTDNGLDKFSIKNKKPISDIYDIDVEIEYFTKRNGLSSNTINSIIEDDNGNLWLGTNTGISFFNVKTKTFTNFSSADGINGTVMNPESALKLNNGLILFGGMDGLNIFDPRKYKPSIYKPDIVITDFQIFNKSVKFGDNSPLEESINTTKKIKLNYKQNVFSFEFAALDYNSPHTIQYAYMLEGFDKDWITSESRRYVTYTNLDAGKYIFKVKSTNADGIWNNENKAIIIIIEPPFWKTLWAYALYVLVFIFGFYSFRKYETKRRRKKEEARLKAITEKAKLKEAELKVKAAEYKTKIVESEKEIEKQQIRNRISTDLHDEIGSNLSSIILLSSLVKQKQEVNEEQKKMISEIYDAAKISAEAIRDIVWFINPISDQISNLVSKLVEITNVMLVNINHEIKKSDFDNTKKLQPNVKKNIILIYKEIINNIIKHSQADFVKIEIKEENNILKISVKDNGIGFNINNKSNGNGLRNLKYRANQINGKLEISSEKKKGTVITFIFNMA